MYCRAVKCLDSEPNLPNLDLCCSTSSMLLGCHNSTIIGFVYRLLPGEGRGNLQDFVLYSVELMTFVTGLAISIPEIVLTTYALLSNFQTQMQFHLLKKNKRLLMI